MESSCKIKLVGALHTYVLHRKNNAKRQLFARADIDERAPPNCPVIIRNPAPVPATSNR